MTSKEALSANLRRLLDDQHMQVKELSISLNLPYSTVLDWCNGNSYPRSDKLDRLAAYFHCTRSDLVDPPTQPGIQIAGNVSGAVVNNGTVNITNSRLIERYNALPESARLIIDQLIDQLSGGKP